MSRNVPQCPTLEIQFLLPTAYCLPPSNPHGDRSMPSVNKVIIVGNLTSDPVTKQLPTQSMVTEFGLAMNRKFKSPDGEDREEVCFVDCAAFGRQAEVIQKYCKKGKSLYIEGRLRFDSWEDKNGHGKRSKLSVVVENFQFLGGRDDQPGGDGDFAAAPSADR